MQHDLRPQAGGGGAAVESGESQVGRTTLTSTMQPRTATSGSGGSGGSGGTPEQPKITPPPDAVDVWSGDDLTAQEGEYSDGHHDPHRAPYERKRHDAPDAKTDPRFNKPGIHNDKPTRNTAARPGAVVHDKQGHTHGIFNLKHDHVIRYLYVCRDGKNEAVPFDVVNRADLVMHNYNASGEDSGGKKRLLLNPAMPQDLYLPNHKHPVKCVLSWLEGVSAAWINVHDLDAGKHITAQHITNSVQARAHKWDPDAAGKTPSAIAKHSSRFVFRNDDVGQADRKDRGPHYKDKDHPRVLAPHQKDGDNVPHYLNKDLRNPAFDANGQPIHKQDSHHNDLYKTRKVHGKDVEDHDHPLYEKVTRSVVAICMNLPEGPVPPLAIDTAVAGESFFVMDDKSFHREVPVYENDTKHSKLVQKWVFGHLAMREGDHLVPDPNRRGWVPLRVLAETGEDKHGHENLHIKPHPEG